MTDVTGFNLATAAEDIQIWDCSNGYSLVKQFNPHVGPVSSIAWSHDNFFLGSASTAGDKVTITCCKNNVYTAKEFHVGEGHTCVAFNSHSRYLLSGGKMGMTTVFDLKTQKQKKTYKDHKGPISSLTFNWNDTYIASGSTLGEIIMYNVVTAQGSSPMRTPKSGAVTQLQYSQYRKSLLGSVSEDGAVCLWDTNTRRLIHSFTDKHCACPMGLAFSPINKMLLMSVGLDKRIVCYDVIGNTAVKTITAENALTCIDVMQDGVTLAAGSVPGNVFIYDLRKGTQPIHKINAHKETVNKVVFQSNFKPMKIEEEPLTYDPDIIPSLKERYLRMKNNRDTSKYTIIWSSRKESPVSNTIGSSVLPDRLVSPSGSAVRFSDPESLSYASDKKNHKNLTTKLPKKGILRRSESTRTTTSSRKSVSSVSNGDINKTTDNKHADINSNLKAPTKDNYHDLNSENRPDVLGRLSVSSVASKNSSMASDGVFSPLNDNSTNTSGRRNLSQQSNALMNSFATPTQQQTSISVISPINNRDQNTFQNLNANSEQMSQRELSIRTPLPGQTAASIYSVQSSACTSPVTTDGSDSGDSTPRRIVNGINHATDSGTATSSGGSMPSSVASSRSQTPIIVQADRPSDVPPLVNLNSATQSISVDQTKQIDDTINKKPETRLVAQNRDISNIKKASAVSPNAAAMRQNSSLPDLQQYEQQVVNAAGTAAYGAVAAAAPNKFHTEFIKGLIEESMEEFRDQVHNDIMHLQMEMLRQFQIQQAEVRGILQHYSVNDQVAAELQQLREENKRLKRKF